MKRFLSLFVACLFALSVTADARLAVTNLHMGKPAAAGGGGGLSIEQSSNCPSTNTAWDGSVDTTLNIGSTASADRMIIIVSSVGMHTGTAGAQTVVVDPAGENVTLTTVYEVVGTSHMVGVFAGIVSAGTGDKTIRVTGNDGSSDWHMICGWIATGIGTDPSTIDKATATETFTGNTGVMNLDVNTDEGGAVLVGCASKSPTTFDWTTQVGHTQVSEDQSNWGGNYTGESLNLASAETPRTVEITAAHANNPINTCISVSIVASAP